MAYNEELTGSVVIDIETIASPEVSALLDPVKAPANYKDPAKIAAYVEEKRAEQIARAGLEPDLCEIVAVGVCGDPGIDFVLTRQDCDEADLIKSLWIAVGERRMIGFNSLGFDLPVLVRRSQVLGLDYPALNLDRYRTPHLDLLERLSFHGRIPFRSLSFYCRRFGLPNTDETSGADIAQMVAAGAWKGVADHCAADVRKTVALAERLGWR